MQVIHQRSTASSPELPNNDTEFENYLDDEDDESIRNSSSTILVQTVPASDSSPPSLSPSRVTKRMKTSAELRYPRSTSLNVSSGSGSRHIDGTTTINIINNFGMSAAKQRKKQQLQQCCILRTFMGMLMVIWLGAMISVFRSGHSSRPVSQEGSSTNSKSNMYADLPVSRNMAQEGEMEKLRAELNAQGNSIRAAASNIAQPDQQEIEAAHIPEQEEESEDDTLEYENESTLVGEENIESAVKEDDVQDTSFANANTDEEENTVEEEVAEAFPKFLTDPTDFKLNTPNAPSCDVPLDTQSISFTFATQLSNDRMWMIPYHCQRWGNNPMAVVIFTNRNATDIKTKAVKYGCSQEHLSIQTVSRTKYDPTGKEYPVNFLRNLALSMVKTSHVVYADVDFWPASNLNSILSLPEVKERFASDPYLATVVPAFQMNRRCRQWYDCREKNIPYMPKSKESLLKLVKWKMASSFDPTNQGGHGSTKYVTWKEQAEGTFVDLTCLKSNRYEPYLAFRYCQDLPPFQEGFTGYGKNKMTWVMQLRRKGYNFSQLGGAFFVHYPHLDSSARSEWNKKPDLLQSKPLHQLDGESKEKINWSSYKRARVDALFLDFREWLETDVKDESRVPMCQDAQNDDQRLWVPPVPRK